MGARLSEEARSLYSASEKKVESGSSPHGGGFCSSILVSLFNSARPIAFYPLMPTRVWGSACLGVASCITTMCDCKTCPPSLLRAPIPSFLSVKPDTNTDTNTELGKRRRNLGTSKALDDEAT